jgi:hypothetical protein
MNRNMRDIPIGVILIVLGGFLLLNNLGIFGNISEILWGGLFAVAGLAGLSYYLTHRRHWWLLIPAFTMFGLSSVLVLESLPFNLGALAGAAFLFFLSLGFWAIFVLQGQQWWPVIPGGVLTVIALITAASEFALDAFIAPFLFIGIGAVFGLLWLMRRRYRTAWAVFPAIGLAAFGIFLALLIGFDQAPGALGALALIAVGAGLLWRNYRRPPSTGQQAAAIGPVLTNGQAGVETMTTERREDEA